MPVVLGIDAAWTATKPSGVALVRSAGLRWRCLAVAPSYDTFVGLRHGTAIDWEQRRFLGESVDPVALLEAAAELAGGPVDVVAIDMPIATVPITSRRHECPATGSSALSTATVAQFWDEFESSSEVHNVLR